MKIPAEILVDINKLILKCIWKGKGTRIAKNNFEKKNEFGGIKISSLTTIKLQ